MSDGVRYMLYCRCCRCRLIGFHTRPHDETCPGCGRVFPDDHVATLFQRPLPPPDWQVCNEVLDGETLLVAHAPHDVPGSIRELLLAWRDES